MTRTLSGISSMATRALLAELADAYRARSGVAVAFESVGGVDAARRVQAGEPFDVVVLAADAIDKLAASGRVFAASPTPLVRSGVAIAVPAGAPHPDVSDAGALRDAVRAARAIGYSTGPSGVALLALFERWGLTGELKPRLVQAPAGVPVGALLARGEVSLGFQQFSELLHVEGIDLLGPMPPGLEIDTTFSAAVCAASARPDDARALIEYLAGPDAEAAKRRQGMTPA